MPDVLDDVPPDSAMYADILNLVNDFVSGRGHLLDFEVLNQNGSLSIVCKLKHKDYAYGTEKILLLVDNIFQKVFEDYPSYTVKKFNQMMVKLKVEGIQRTIPVILKSYGEIADMSNMPVYRAPGSFDFATLPNEKGEYFYEMGDFFLGSIQGMDNIHLPMLGFIDLFDNHYRILYPIYEEVRKEGDISFHKLVGFGISDLSEAFDSLQKALSILKRHLNRLEISPHERRRLASWFNMLPSHPIELYLKYDAPSDAAKFISILLNKEESYALKSLSKRLSEVISENERKLLEEIVNLMRDVSEKCQSARSYDDTLQRMLAFREAVRIAKERDSGVNIVRSSIRNVSRSGAGKSIYLGKEELELVPLEDKALVKIVEYQPFRYRIEIYPA